MTQKLRKEDVNFPGGACPQTLLEACTLGARLGNRSLFMLDPRLGHLKSGIPPPALGITVNDP